MNIKEFIESRSTAQKLSLMFLCALPFLYDFYDSLPTIGDDGEMSLYLASYVVCLVSYVLFPKKGE